MLQKACGLQQQRQNWRMLPPQQRRPGKRFNAWSDLLDGNSIDHILPKK